MKITINGEEHFFDDLACVNDLVVRFGLDVSTVAIERNMAIVPCSMYGVVSLVEGDQIEIVHFIGGG